MRDHRKARLQTFIGLTPQFFHLVLGKARQDRVVGARAIGAALCNLDRVFNRLGQISEECHHLFGGFEIMLRCQDTAWFLLIDIGPLRNADQRVMRLIHFWFGEIDVIGRHKGQAHLIGHINQMRLTQRLCLGQTLIYGVTL